MTKNTCPEERPRVYRVSGVPGVGGVGATDGADIGLPRDLWGMTSSVCL